MSEPLIYQVILNIQTALRGISQSTGYNYTVRSSSVIVDPANVIVAPLTETPIFVIGHRVEPVGERSFTTSRPNAVKERWRVTMEIVVDVENDLEDGSKKAAARFRLVQDIERALTVDPTRGGIALYTYVMQDTAYPDIESQTRLYLEVPVDILMQRSYGTV